MPTAPGWYPTWMKTRRQDEWCSGVGRARRLLAQRASPPFGARGQSTKNLHRHSQAVEVFNLAMQQGLRSATRLGLPRWGFSFCVLGRCGLGARGTPQQSCLRE
jgi:hypothetical protein